MKKIIPLTIIVFVLFFRTNLSAQFTQGNLAVLQIGDGVNTLTSTGNPLTFREFNTSGTPTYSVIIPSTGTSALILRGSATSEGYISKSSDGLNIVFGAYLQSLPNSVVLNSSSASAINRGVGIMDGLGNYSLVAGVGISGIAAGDIRGATGTNNTNVWATSSSQGLSYYGSTSTATNVENTKTNLRAAHIFNNQLYISSQVASGTPTDIGVYSVGTGTPNSSGQSVTTVINTGANSQPGQFYFNSAGTICYIADSRNSNSGGIQKWINLASVWTLTYTLPTGTAAVGAYGVVADFSGTSPIVYATTSESNNNNRLVAIIDNGSAATATTLASATPSNTFRGLVFSPAAVTCTPPAFVSIAHNSPTCSIQNLILTTSVTGSGPLNYTWSGMGAFSSTSAPNPTVINPSAGTYTVAVGNNCGTTQTVISTNVNPTPTLNVNAATICSGGTATLTASGATTYSWSNTSINPTLILSPTITTTYTLYGSSAGCSAIPKTTTIAVTTSPTLTVNSATICIGGFATLTANGASSYTWSNNTQSASIVISPTINSVFSVSSSISGCSANLNANATVVVNPLPVVTFSLDKNSFCLSDSPSSISILPSGGNLTGTGISGGNFSPNIAGIGTYSLSYSYTASTGCYNKTIQVVNVNTCIGIIEKSNELDISIFPNPTHDILKIHFTTDFIESKISILDITGKILLEKNISQRHNEIIVSDFEKGIYIFRLSNVKKTVHSKFIKE